jgi:hypothetical protein
VPVGLRRARSTRAGWTPSGLATALIGTAAAVRLGARGWIRQRLGARRPGRSRVKHVPPQVVREPESGWRETNPEPGETAVTVAVVGDAETRWGTEAVVSRLAELAVSDELLIVYGSGPRTRPGHHAVTAGLRDHLPRHQLVALHVAQHDGELRRDAAAALGQFLEDGRLPVVVTPAAAMHEVTAEISTYLRADRVLRVARTTAGADLHQVWRRRAATAQARP